MLGVSLGVGVGVVYYSSSKRPKTLLADTVSIPPVVEITVSDSRNAFDVFCFHLFMIKKEGEIIWRCARVSFLSQLICSLGMFLSGGLAFPWLVEFYYLNLVLANPELKDAVEVRFTGEDLLMPCLKSAALNLITLGGDFIFGFTHARLARATGSSLVFRRDSPKIRFI